LTITSVKVKRTCFRSKRAGAGEKILQQQELKTPCKRSGFPDRVTAYPLETAHRSFSGRLPRE
jgi:hypothetical protein